VNAENTTDRDNDDPQRQSHTADEILGGVEVLGVRSVIDV